MQVLPFSQASCPQITVISAGLHSCFVTAIMRKYCFRVREISKVRKKECAIQLLYPQHALYMPLYLTPNAIKKKKKVVPCLKIQITINSTRGSHQIITCTVLRNSL